jgi:hypothetical protein
MKREWTLAKMSPENKNKKEMSGDVKDQEKSEEDR